jgi:hypothetical protein
MTMATAAAKKAIGKEVDNLELHQRMYERRLRILREREEHPDSDPGDGSSDTEIVKRKPTKDHNNK